MRKIWLLFMCTAFLALVACSSSVSFRVIDKKTNEDIKDYRVRVQGPGIDNEFSAGQKIKLSNGMFAPPQYTADIEADGYTKNSAYKLQRRFCYACFKMFGTASKQTVYMSRDDSSSTSVEPEAASPAQ